MSGDLVLRSTLLADAEWSALVPAESTIADDAAPQGLAPPYALIAVVSTVDRNILKPGETRHVTERVELTFYANSAKQRREMKRIARKAAADTMPVFAGLTSVTIHTDSAGPNFTTDASIRVGSQDFKVTYSEPR